MKYKSKGFIECFMSPCKSFQKYLFILSVYIIGVDFAFASMHDWYTLSENDEDAKRLIRWIPPMNNQQWEGLYNYIYLK